ncbi:MAG: hypothetical protein ACSW73_03035 [Spirochaetales bacterium]
MNLYEQQSTYNPNMPVRMLIYAAQLYDEFLVSKGLKDSLYDYSLIQLPYPKLIAFYNGERFQPDRTELRLSDAFTEGAKGDIQVKVTMLNVNYGRNRKLMQNCRPLSDYSLFTSNVRKLNKKVDMEDAVEAALEELPDDSEVKRLILENKAAVTKMILFEYDEKGVMESLKQEAWEDGKAEGIAQGKAEGISQVASTMKQAGYDLDAISKLTGISVEELKKL